MIFLERLHHRLEIPVLNPYHIAAFGADVENHAAWHKRCQFHANNALMVVSNTLHNWKLIEAALNRVLFPLAFVIHNKRQFAVPINL